MSKETPKKKKTKNAIIYDRRRFPLLRRLYHIRYDPNDKTLQFKTPFTGGKWEKDPYLAISKACAEYRLTDETLEPILNGFDRDTPVDWKALRGSITKKIKCDDATAKQIALYAFLHSSIHAPALSAENAINNFYLTPYEQWATTEGTLTEMPTDVRIERSYEHFTKDGKKCMENWVYNNQQHHFCEGKNGPKRGPKDSKRPFCRVALQDTADDTSNADMIDEDKCACSNKWSYQQDFLRCDPESANVLDDEGNELGYTWCMYAKSTAGCVDLSLRYIKDNCKEFIEEIRELAGVPVGQDMKGKIGKFFRSHGRTYPSHLEFYRKYVQLHLQYEKTQKTLQDKKEYIEAIENEVKRFNESNEATEFRIGDVADWSYCEPIQTIRGTPSKKHYKNLEETESDCTRCDFLPNNTHFDLKGQSKQKRLADQNKMLEMYRKREVNSIRLLVGQEAYVTERLEHMVEDDVDIMEVIENTNIKEDQFRFTIGTTNEKRLLSLRQNDVYYMLDYHFQKQYKIRYQEDSAESNTTTDNDSNLSAGKYQIIGGGDTLVLPILWEVTFKKNIPKAYFSHTPGWKHFNKDNKKTMVDELKKQVHKKLKKQWNEAIRIENWPDLYDAWKWHSKNGEAHQGGTTKKSKTKKAVCDKKIEECEADDNCMVVGEVGCLPRKSLGIYAFTYDPDIIDSVNHEGKTHALVHYGTISLEDDRLPSTRKDIETVFETIQLNVFKRFRHEFRHHFLPGQQEAAASHDEQTVELKGSGDSDEDITMTDDEDSDYELVEDDADDDSGEDDSDEDDFDDDNFDDSGDGEDDSGDSGDGEDDFGIEVDPSNVEDMTNEAIDDEVSNVMDNIQNATKYVFETYNLSGIFLCEPGKIKDVFGSKPSNVMSFMAKAGNEIVQQRQNIQKKDIMSIRRDVDENDVDAKGWSYTYKGKHILLKDNGKIFEDGKLVQRNDEIDLAAQLLKYLNVWSLPLGDEDDRFLFADWYGSLYKERMTQQERGKYDNMMKKMKSMKERMVRDRSNDEIHKIADQRLLVQGKMYQKLYNEYETFRIEYEKTDENGDSFKDIVHGIEDVDDLANPKTNGLSKLGRQFRTRLWKFFKALKKVKDENIATVVERLQRSWKNDNELENAFELLKSIEDDREIRESFEGLINALRDIDMSKIDYEKIIAEKVDKIKNLTLHEAYLEYYSFWEKEREFIKSELDVKEKTSVLDTGFKILLRTNSIYEDTLQHRWDVFEKLTNHIKEKINEYRSETIDADKYTGLPYFPQNVRRIIGGGGKRSLPSPKASQSKKKKRRVTLMNVSNTVSEKIGVYEREGTVKDENGLTVTIRFDYNMNDYFFEPVDVSTKENEESTTTNQKKKRVSPTLVSTQTTSES